MSTIANEIIDDYIHSVKDWAGCCRAANRLMDMVCLMYHPGDTYTRKVAPTAAWAEIIASELGIEIPGVEYEKY